MRSYAMVSVVDGGLRYAMVSVVDGGLRYAMVGHLRPGNPAAQLRVAFRTRNVETLSPRPASTAAPVTVHTRAGMLRSP